MNSTTLYRPVGQKELDLIEETAWTAFPPRLPFQPIFYPVVHKDYAITIARDWNTKDEASSYVGYVTQFEVDSTYLSQYPVKQAGSTQHLEYWIPAEDLEQFNQHIIGTIDVVETYKGPQFDKENT